jgi:uncharacterized protein YndB with AHSA1/START domain
MVHIEVAHTFPVPVSEAFAYITDLKNWPEYWPRLVRIENPAEARWSNPGDKVTVVIGLLGREQAMHMELREFVRDERAIYDTRQPGLPDARHERHFRAVGAGCEFRPVVEYEPRQGVAGIFDRLVVKRSVAGVARKTARNLDRVFRQRQPGPKPVH